MEVFNAVRGPLANFPKVLFAARFVQPVAVAVAAILEWKKRGEDAFEKDGKLCRRCAFVGITACAISNAVLLATLFFPMAKWIKVVSAISSVASWEFFTAAICEEASDGPKGIKYAWPIIGALSSAVMALGAGGLFTFSPIILVLAAVSLVVESLMRSCDAVSGKDCFGVILAIVLALSEAALALLYISPFIGVPIPWFVNLLLCLLPAVQIAVSAWVIYLE